jgi:hypothetical protein
MGPKPTRGFQKQGAEVSLSGNLGFVSLDEVLRLLTRSSQQGSVDVRGEQIRGRIFITKAGIGLATTSDDEGLHRHLVKSGLVDNAYLEDVESGAGNLAPTAEKSGGAIVELIREMTVESIYQLGLHGDSFEVSEGANSRYASPQAFELEELLGDSKRRLTDWVEVSRAVDDLKAPVAFVRDLGDREEIKIDNESWKVLSEVGSGASVSQMADELGTTEFWTARITARLIEKDLLSFVAEEANQASVEETSSVEWAAPEQNANAQTRSDQTDEEDVDPQESWWEEPEAEEKSVDQVADVVEEADDSEETDTAPRSLQDMILAAEEDSSAEIQDEAQTDVEADAQDDAQDDASETPIQSEDSVADEVEEDTEAFLEKVFSELETPEEPEEEEGYGLLRRRRMGAIRDLSGDA